MSREVEFVPCTTEQLQGGIVEQWKVDSQSSTATYVVSLHANGGYSCGCLGWTRHTPRRDCKHITWVKTFGPEPIDPLIMATMKARRKAGVL